MSIQFASIMDFLIMDGHGAYVWSSYLLTFFLLMSVVIVPSIQHRRLIKRFQRHRRINEARTRSKN